MRRAIFIAAMLACMMARAEDWNMLGALWTEPTGGLALGNAVDLDGISEYFTDNSSSNLADGSVAMSFVVWVKNREMTNAGILNTATPSSGLYFRNTPAIRLYINNTVLSLPGTFTNDWLFLCGTWTTNGRAGIIYTNGASAATSAAMSSDPLTNTNSAWYLGISGSVKLNGSLDEVAIFVNRDLTAAEIAELYNGGKGKRVETLSTGTNGLVRLYHLDETGSASNAYDSASGTTATGNNIGTGDWVTGKIPLP